MNDVLKVPEGFFMLFDTIVAFDHFFQVVKVITYMKVPENLENLESAYNDAQSMVQETIAKLKSDDLPLPVQPPIELDREYKSNIGREGYEGHVNKLKEHIAVGDIIQCVPSQRFSRPTSLHPFNIYRHLRTVNPSPYLFYLECEDFQIIGASPELLVKADQGRIITHPIAGTVKRGKTMEEDERLAEELRSSLKDRAEHVMLVDLARNDVNRVCDPLSTRVDRLMVVQKFSHVQHLVSEVSGVLRSGKTRFDAFRSIFPAGTVSGAPKVRAMELIAELEKEKRGVYAGAVGYFGYGSVNPNGGEEEGAMDTVSGMSSSKSHSHSIPCTNMHTSTLKPTLHVSVCRVARESYCTGEFEAFSCLELSRPSFAAYVRTTASTPHVLLQSRCYYAFKRATRISSQICFYWGRNGWWPSAALNTNKRKCIALRTMMTKDGVAYLQAGGGIVFDSDPYDEWVETMNKLGANMQCITSAEKKHLAEQQAAKQGQASGQDGGRAHIDLAAG